MHCREEEEIVDFLDLQSELRLRLERGVDIQLQPHPVELASFPRRQDAQLISQKYVLETVRSVFKWGFPKYGLPVEVMVMDSWPRRDAHSVMKCDMSTCQNTAQVPCVIGAGKDF